MMKCIVGGLLVLGYAAFLITLAGFFFGIGFGVYGC